MTTCKDCYRRNPATGYCPVRTYEVEEDHEPCGSYATPPRDMNEPKEEATKVCKRCGKELPLSSFSRNRNGLLGVCKDCMKAAQKKGAKPEKPAEPEAPKEEPVHPELYESEDERIREGLIHHLKELRDWEVGTMSPIKVREYYDAWIAYLEKHKEQKPSIKEPKYESFEDGNATGWRIKKQPAGWSEDEKKVLDSIIDDYEKAAKSFCGYDGKIMLLKAIRDGEYDLPKQEWSEEDEEILDSLIRLYSKEYSADAWPWANGAITYGDVVKFLKSLRPQPHWKPSQEQIRVFLKANPVNLMPEELSVYNSLCNDIQKLKADPAPDYEKKYKDALGWMKTIYRVFGEDLRESVDHFFPELQELCPNVVPTTLLTGSGGISYPSVLYAVESWKDEQVRFFLKDVVRILRDRGYQINAEIVVTEKF